jgi:hypothetical protein
MQDSPKNTQIWIFGLKIYHLATLLETSSVSAKGKNLNEERN